MPIFINQYGCKRSGTEWTAALVTANFHDVTVIVHGLGGKHGMPEPYSQSKEYRGRTPLGKALRRGEVRLLITVKDPYAWIRSYIKQHLKWAEWFRQGSVSYTHLTLPTN